MIQAKRYAEHVTFVCDECEDIFTVCFWVRSRKDGRLSGVIERQSTLVDVKGTLRHRPGHCGGTVVPYNLSRPLVVER